MPRRVGWWNMGLGIKEIATTRVHIVRHDDDASGASDEVPVDMDCKESERRDVLHQDPCRPWGARAGESPYMWWENRCGDCERSTARWRLGRRGEDPGRSGRKVEWRGICCARQIMR